MKRATPVTSKCWRTAQTRFQHASISEIWTVSATRGRAGRGITRPLAGFQGTIACQKDSCRLLSVIVNSGVGGVYTTGAAVDNYARRFETAGHSEYRHSALQVNSLAIARLCAQPQMQTYTPAQSQARRLLASTGQPLNPSIICLLLGEGLLFDLSQGGPTSYPVYVKVQWHNLQVFSRP